MKVFVVVLLITIIASATAAPLLFISTAKKIFNGIFVEKTTKFAERNDTFTPLPPIEMADRNGEFSSDVLMEIEESLADNGIYKPFATLPPVHLTDESVEFTTNVLNELDDRLVNMGVQITTTTALPVEIKAQTEAEIKAESAAEERTFSNLIISKLTEQAASSKIIKTFVNCHLKAINLIPNILQKRLLLDKLALELEKINSQN